jgi:hypothetical protein
MEHELETVKPLLCHAALIDVTKHCVEMRFARKLWYGFCNNLLMLASWVGSERRVPDGGSVLDVDRE